VVGGVVDVVGGVGIGVEDGVEDGFGDEGRIGADGKAVSMRVLKE